MASAPERAPVELHAAISVRFDGGASGAISGASYHAGAQNNRHQLEIRIFGSDRQFHADLERDRLWYWREGAGRAIALPTDAGAYHCQGPSLSLLDLILGRDVTNASPMQLGARTVEPDR